jgi:hypothetical protein
MIFGRYGLYHAATESAAYERLGLIAQLFEIAEELTADFLDAHPADCPCAWCRYDWRANGGGVAEDVNWLRVSLGISVGHITSHVNRPDLPGETPAERLRLLAYRLKCAGTTRTNPPWFGSTRPKGCRPDRLLLTWDRPKGRGGHCVTLGYWTPLWVAVLPEGRDRLHRVHDEQTSPGTDTALILSMFGAGLCHRPHPPRKVHAGAFSFHKGARPGRAPSRANRKRNLDFPSVR